MATKTATPAAKKPRAAKNVAKTGRKASKPAAATKATKAKAKAKAKAAPTASRNGEALGEATASVLKMLAKARATRSELKAKVDYANYTKLVRNLVENGLAKETKLEDDSYTNLEITAKGRKYKV